MTHPRLPYADASTTREMTSDCRAVESALQLPGRRSAAGRVRGAAARPAPSLRFDEQPREVSEPLVEVSEAAARLGSAFSD